MTIEDKASLYEDKLWELLDIVDEDGEGNVRINVEPEDFTEFIDSVHLLLNDLSEDV